MKHDDLYARAWEFEYETPTFSSDRVEPDNNNSTEITVRQGLKMTKRVPIQEPQKKAPQKFSLKQMGFVTELIRVKTTSLMRKPVQNSLTLLMLIPAAQGLS